MSKGLLTPDAWVHLTPQTRGRVRLFCFPYAGGGRSVYFPWLSAISPDIEVCPVQLPGREERLGEPPFTCMELLIEKLVEVLRSSIDGPFAFYGHSLGALISFELARALRRLNGPTPIHLFVSGCPAPQLPPTDPPIHQMPDVEFVQALRRFNGTSEKILQNAELLFVLLPFLRADFTLYETYTYATEAPLEIPISAYGGLEDFRTTQASVQAWREQTNRTFIMRMYPGDHFFIHAKRTILLRGIRQDLAVGVEKIST